MTTPKERPGKPYDGFPLFAHRNGQWAKKILGTMRYFGAWSDWKAALLRYEKERDAWYSGRKPQEVVQGTTMKALCDQFVSVKRSLVESGELTETSWKDYHRTCKLLIEQFGCFTPVELLTPSDFEEHRASLAKTRGPVALGNEINRARIVFRYAYESMLIDKPVRFGPTFKRPSAKIVRRAHRDRNKIFEPSELRAIIEAATPTLAAMSYLGINCGLGNADCGFLEFDRLDLSSAWLTYARRKTGIARRCPLWPETVAALQLAIEKRPKHRTDDLADRVFLTRYRNAWHTGQPGDPISHAYRKLLKSAGVYRPGLGFYSLRHTFQTIGEGAGDLPAVQSIMGHSAKSDDMSSVYRGSISNERLQAVTDYVRSWLFPELVSSRVSSVKTTNRKPNKNKGAINNG